MNNNKNILNKFGDNYSGLLEFLRAKYPLFHDSNFFIRDLQFGIQKYLENKEIFITYNEANYLAKEIGNYLEQNSVFIKINNRTWKINQPDFKTINSGDPF